jgi:hypothetical protein
MPWIDQRKFANPVIRKQKEFESKQYIRNEKKESNEIHKSALSSKILAIARLDIATREHSLLFRSLELQYIDSQRIIFD